MREICKGDRAAFGVLVRRHEKYFYAIAYRYTNDRESAEDLIQDAFLKLWQKPHHFDETRGASWKTWFARIVVNLGIDFTRRRKWVLEIPENTESNEQNAFDATSQKMQANALELAIRQLPPEQITAVNLGLSERIPYAQVAEIMKKSEAAVKSLIMRAKENLKCSLAKMGYENETEI